MDWFLYRLLPPRPDFATTMDDAEADAMGRHVTYWTGHLASGTVVVFSPVGDPTGVWGLALVRAASADDVAALGAADPAVVDGVARFDVLPLLDPVTHLP